jgi:hypothetical protein
MRTQRQLSWPPATVGKLLLDKLLGASQLVQGAAVDCLCQRTIQAMLPACHGWSSACAWPAAQTCRSWGGAL